MMTMKMIVTEVADVDKDDNDDCDYDDDEDYCDNNDACDDIYETNHHPHHQYHQHQHPHHRHLLTPTLADTEERKCGE